MAPDDLIGHFVTKFCYKIPVTQNLCNTLVNWSCSLFLVTARCLLHIRTAATAGVLQSGFTVHTLQAGCASFRVSTRGQGSVAVPDRHDDPLAQHGRRGFRRRTYWVLDRRTGAFDAATDRAKDRSIRCLDQRMGGWYRLCIDLYRGLIWMSLDKLIKLNFLHLEPTRSPGGRMGRTSGVDLCLHRTRWDRSPVDVDAEKVCDGGGAGSNGRGNQGATPEREKRILADH